MTPTTDSDIFQGAVISRATDAAVARYLQWIAGKNAVLEVGRALHCDGKARVLLQAEGFDRHTFLCGQSGSGKTFALGVIIEQLLLETDLRIVVIDPNSDFTGLDQLHSIDEINKTRSVELDKEQYEWIVERFGGIRPSLCLMRPEKQGKHGSNSLRIRLSDLEPHEQEAILRPDPLADPEECRLFWTTVDILMIRALFSKRGLGVSWVSWKNIAYAKRTVALRLAAFGPGNSNNRAGNRESLPKRWESPPGP